MFRRVVANVTALAVGSDHDPALRPILALKFLSMAGFGTFWGYLGIWAIKFLGIRPGAVGLVFLATALAFAGCSSIGGNLSDKMGRRKIVTAALAAQSIALGSLVAVQGRVVIGAALAIAIAIFTAPVNPAVDALVADLVLRNEQETAYAATRVAANLGAVIGPPAGALALATAGWDGFIGVITALSAVTLVVAVRFLPDVKADRQVDEKQRGIRLAIVDRPFVLLVASTFLAYVVFVGYEAVLPVVAVGSFHLRAATWGIVLAINPLLVILLQYRLTRWTRRIAPTIRFGVGFMLMGFPFALLAATHSVPVIVLVVSLFVFGEMLWAPTAQAIAARLAPAGRRGAYMGLLASSGNIAWMVCPLIALRLQGALGDGAVWALLVGASVIGVVTGTLACGTMAEEPIAASDSAPA